MTVHANDKRRAPLILLALTLTIAACGDDDGVSPTQQGPVPADFSTYVALGNSLTAGYQSAGINDSTQRESYAVLVAQSMGLAVGTGFTYPSLTGLGCTPPIVNIFTGQRVGGGLATDCFGRADDALPHNVAVPGAAVIDLFSNTDARSNANPLTTLFLGGLTQLAAAAQLQPTFVSAWIGSNDVLAAALNGDASLITDFDQFKADLDIVVRAIDDMNPTGAILIGVPNVLSIPNLSPGAAYWVGAQRGLLPPGVTVAANCATAEFGGVGETTLVPFAYGFGVVFATGGTLDCLADAAVVNAFELVQILAAVGRFNTAIEREATARGWAYLDPNILLDSIRATGEIPLFPNTSGLDALISPFGKWFSRDGFHINGAANVLIAAHVIDAINAKYSTSLPRP
ncbi:MAG: SGNH/GDSL hydrolase family protein [Gemmatimonadetes bacterium]|nr:SGNH/GDSL hydrolase family protein [Gemmatimonadota bacterium]